VQGPASQRPKTFVEEKGKDKLAAHDKASELSSWGPGTPAPQRPNNFVVKGKDRDKLAAHDNASELASWSPGTPAPQRPNSFVEDKPESSGSGHLCDKLSSLSADKMTSNNGVHKDELLASCPSDGSQPSKVDQSVEEKPHLCEKLPLVHCRHSRS
jgi:hypothetical protein